MLKQLKKPPKNGLVRGICHFSNSRSRKVTLTHLDTTCTRDDRRSGGQTRLGKNRTRRGLGDPTGRPLAGLMIAKGKTQAHLPARQQLESQGTAVLHAVAVRNQSYGRCNTEMQTGFARGMGIFMPQRGFHQQEGKQNSNCEVVALSGVQQRARCLIICFSIA